MGKGKKERSKKNKNKKETRKPIKREFEGKKISLKSHPLQEPSLTTWHQRALDNERGISDADRHLYEKMFSY